MHNVDRTAAVGNPIEGWLGTKSHSTVIRVDWWVDWWVGWWVGVTSPQDATGVDTRCGWLVGSGSVAATVVYIFQIEGMDVTGEITGKWLADEQLCIRVHLTRE